MALIAAAAVLIVAIGAGLFFALRPGHQPISTAAQSGLSSPIPSAPQTAQDSASAPPTVSSAPSALSSASAAPSPAPAPSSVGSVIVSAGAAQNSDATAVAAFINQYFSAINSHNFQAYYSLLAPQQQKGQTSETFSTGYSSTVDSDETLSAISTAANGDTAAKLIFISHQNAAQSEDGTNCTDWNITLFLESSATGYLIGQGPASYHSHYESCSS
jgi:hypothetical protein